MKTDEITFVGHIALGDLLLLSAMGVYLSQYFTKVYFPARASDRASLETFFVNHPKIELYWPDAKPGLDPFLYPAPGHVLRTGIYHYPFALPRDDRFSFIENYYLQAAIPYSVRWDYCPIAGAARKVEQYPIPKGEYEFIHDDPARGFHIRGDFKNPFFVGNQSRQYSILRYVELIRYARKVRVIDSCFLHLAESIKTLGELIYHKSVRPLEGRFNDVDAPSRKHWKVI